MIVEISTYDTVHKWLSTKYLVMIMNLLKSKKLQDPQLPYGLSSEIIGFLLK